MIQDYEMVRLMTNLGCVGRLGLDYSVANEALLRYGHDDEVFEKQQALITAILQISSDPALVETMRGCLLMC